MIRQLLSDRRGRTAYVLTKVGVLAVAAVATWPLARVFGVRAWYALGAFAVLLVGITVVVVLGSLSAGPTRDEDSDDEVEDDDEPPHSEEPLALPVEDSLDLHAFAPRDIPDVVTDYLEAAHAAGHHEVRLIHGRGIGVQRQRVQSLLGRHALVRSFHDAPPERGGWGATVAYLVDIEPDEQPPTRPAQVGPGATSDPTADRTARTRSTPSPHPSNE